MRFSYFAARPKLDDALVDALLSDIDAGVAKDALPLLAFTLERLYGEYGDTGHLTLEHYTKLGRVKGSIEAAVERAFKAADGDSRIPREREARLALLRRGLIPWIANIDPDTKAPRRRVARPGEIPEDAQPLIDLLVEQRLLARDVDEETDEVTLEPAHEALLRQWGQLKAWLSEDTGLLTVMDGIKRAAAEWNDKGRTATWLAHTGERLRAAERLLERPDLAANLQDVDLAYIAAAQKRERTIIRQRWGSYAALAVLLGLIGTAWVTRDQWEGPLDVVRYAAWNSVAEDITKPGTAFKDCTACPEMVTVPAGRFMMGSDENGGSDEKPVREVTISKPFAVGKFEVTFNEWRACVEGGGCNSNETPSDSGWGQDNRPVINVSWEDAQEYVTWLSAKTGQTYRLLTEAEWEYAARAGTTSPWSFEGGEDKLGEYAWYSANSGRKTHPVGEKKPNAFGLYDMHGNVWEWVSDWYGDYESGPQTDPQGPSTGQGRVGRGGSWFSSARHLRSAFRVHYTPGSRDLNLGFRLARTYD